MLFARLPGHLLSLKANEMRVKITHAFLVDFRVFGLNLTLFHRGGVAVM